LFDHRGNSLIFSVIANVTAPSLIIVTRAGNTVSSLDRNREGDYGVHHYVSGSTAKIQRRVFMASRRPASRLLIILALVVLASTSLQAQTVTGTMQGKVTDTSGAVLPGVTVTIRNMETGLERVAVTNGEGFFSAPFLPVGRYRVVAEMAGLGTMRREGVPVNLNQTTVQDFAIDPSISETITVNAEVPRVNVTDGEIKQTMQSEEIMALPAGNQTSFLHLAQNFSGFQENMTSGQDNPTASSGSSINFNGAGTRGTTFQIDGVNNDDTSENQHRQGVALATIKSFQVLTNSFSSEFGRGYGAVLLVQTKSGTNSLDGEVYGYFQDNEYNEQTHFDRVNNVAKPGNYWRQYGLTAGFPILRDTLFGYVSADEVENEGDLNFVRDIFVPSDLSLPRLTLGNDTPANRAFQDSIMARFPNVAPNDTRSARAYNFAGAFERPRTDYSGRVDYNLSANNVFTTRYQRSHQIFDNAELIVGEQTQQNNRQSNFGLTWTGIISSDTVQEGRIGIGLRSTNVNIKAGNDTPIVRFVGTTFPSIIGNAGQFPINRNQRDNQVVYNISSARWANHTVKGGLDLRESQLNDIADNFSRGFWNIGATCAGVTYPSAYHAFMAGCISTFQKGYGPFNLKNDISEGNAYAQDDWHIRDNLIVNVGVRFEYVKAPEEADGKIDYFYGDSSYVDPRLGFAYTPNWDSNRWLRAITGGQGKFSIRGGYGHYHGRVFQSIFSQGGANVRFNPPNAAFLTFTNSTNIADPTNGFVFVPGQPLTTRVALTIVDPDLKMPETRQWNLTFEREIFARTRLRASYVGTLGKNLMQYSLDNLPIRPDDPRSQYRVAADWRCAGTGLTGAPVNATCPTAVPLAADEISLRFPRINERRPDARYTTNIVVSNAAESWYHAGQLEWETGVIGGFQGRMTYTFSKAEDTGSEATFVGTGDSNILGPYEDYNRGPSRFDTRHRFTMTGNYALPFLRDRADLIGSLFGGWNVTTSVRLSSGTPFTIIDGGAPDFNFDGVGNGRPVCVREEYCSGWHVNNPNGSQQEMPRDAFRRVEYGDDLSDLVGRNSMYTDGAEIVDLGLYKSFALPFSGHSVQLRLQGFNVFDRVTWSWPVNDFNNANFGRILATNYSPRTLQAGIRYIY
jgi:outer membrane receptor protein involved in Fe transport